jgi:hypothetical protein
MTPTRTVIAVFADHTGAAAAVDADVRSGSSVVEPATA